MGALTDVRAVALDDVPVIELPNGSWSRMVVTDESVSGNGASIGYSVFTPGTATDWSVTTMRLQLPRGSSINGTSSSGTARTSVTAPTGRP